MRIHEGIYAVNNSPQFEFSAEIRMLKRNGAIGMSTCHKVAVAYQMGMRIFACSFITNVTNVNASKSIVVTHEDVLKRNRKHGKEPGVLFTKLSKIYDFFA